MTLRSRAAQPASLSPEPRRDRAGGGGAWTRLWLAACLLVLQYDVHPFVGLSFGPITFLICVLGGLGNFVGGFVAAFVGAPSKVSHRSLR
jgi:hypothetical protein